MALAARAIIINEAGKLLVMRRNKQGSDYYTLVGGLIDDDENPEQALIREVKEETGLTLTAASLVFTERHPEPYNSQYIYLSEAEDYESVAIQDATEEAILNKEGINIHEPMWVNQDMFARLPFLTTQLQNKIVECLNRGFPDQPVAL